MEVYYINFLMVTFIITTRVSLESREVVVRLIDYNTIHHYVEFKLFERLLNEWKEFILKNERS
jgi:hypothetical protein